MTREPPIWTLTATRLQARLRTGALSAEAVMAATLEHVARREGDLKAFSHVDAEGAMEAARQADRRLAQGAAPGPLHGIPVSVKDLIGVRGLPLTYASRVFEHDLAEDDVSAVARLRAAGAIPFAKSTTPEFGHKVLTDSPLVGVSRNPWDPALTCGGSSGGAGIAAAMGFGPLHVTSDGAGSGRIPAACCGVVGLKPTWGAVAHEATTDLFGSLTCLGQMARTVADVALLFNAMKGPDPRDPWSHGGSAGPVGLPDDPVAALSGLRFRLALRTNNDWVHPHVEARVRAAVEALAGAGAREVALPGPVRPDIASALVLMRAYQSARFGALIAAEGHRMDRTVRLGLDPANAISYERLRDAQRARTDMFREVERLLDGADVFITPTVAAPPPPVEQQADAPLVVDGVERGPLRQAWYPYTIPYNATGHPAISVPCGFTDAGLPVGIQIAGRWHDEARLLAVAAALEKLMPWADVWPAAAGHGQA